MDYSSDTTRQLTLNEHLRERKEEQEEFFSQEYPFQQASAQGYQARNDEPEG